MALHAYQDIALAPPLADEERSAGPWMLVHNGAALGEGDVVTACPQGSTAIIVGERRHCVSPCPPGFERRISPAGLPACVKPPVPWWLTLFAGGLAVYVLGKAR